MAGGRPMIWKDPIELADLIADYFNETDRPTLSGLAVFLEIDRQTLYNYKERDQFFDIIKKATAKVESIYEERAIYENNPTGVIFALKNMGWTDRLENNTNLSGEVKTKVDLGKLSDAELRIIAELQRKSGVSEA